MPWFEAAALHAQGDLEWGRGALPEAVSAFEEKLRVIEDDGIRDTDLSPLPELVEPPRPARAPRRAAALAARCAAEARVKGGTWRLARARRADALVDDAEAERHYAEALALHADDPDAFERARTELCLGERLRRIGRRTDAREPLRAALATFDALGAAPWAERASAELKATGETVRRRDAASLDELTPQELRIALLLAEGQTTRQAAAALYLSPKTVEYHLRHVYLKLGVNSRAALAQALRAGGGRRPGVERCALGLRARFQHEVERRLGGPPDAGEADRSSTAFSRASPRLRAERQPDLLRQRAGRAQQRRERVVRAPDRVEVVLDRVAGPRLDDHPRAAGRERGPHLARDARRVAHVVQAVERGHEVVAVGRQRVGRDGRERHAVTDARLGRQPPRLGDRAVVGVGAVDGRLRVRVGDDDRGRAVAAADVGHAAAGPQLLLDALERRDPRLTMFAR